MQATNDSDEHLSGRRVELTRGLILIVLAVAVGAFVVTQGLSDDVESAAGSDVVAGASESASLGSDGADAATEGEAEGAADDIGGATAESDPTVDAADGGTDPASPSADDGDGTGAADPTTDSTVDTGGEATTGDSTGDGSPGAVPAGEVPAGEVKVLVLNGAGAKGIAARGSAVLQNAGYDVLAPRNANFLGPSKILYTAGFEAAAADIAGAYSVDPAAVVEPLDPATPPINETHDADVIVVVGEDGLIQV